MLLLAEQHLLEQPSLPLSVLDFWLLLLERLIDLGCVIDDVPGGGWHGCLS